jgi:dienelactone hydrolase
MLRTALLAWAVAIANVAIAQPTGGIESNFDSKNADGTRIQLRGVMYKPTGTSRGAVVLVHGSGGWSDSREGHYGRAFSAKGYTVLAIDSFGPRGIGSTVEDQSRVSSFQMTMDAFHARRHLVSLGLDANRMAIMGFSKGGQVALMAADSTFLPSEVERFTLAIPFYPGCGIRPLSPKPTSTMFMVLGEKDDWTGVKPCQELANDYVRAGGQAQVKVYPGAPHWFDGDPNNLRAIRLSTAENYIDCIVEISPEGHMVYAGKKYLQGDVSILSDLRKSCMKRGATVWTNPTQKQRATEDVLAFLNASFP